MKVFFASAIHLFCFRKRIFESSAFYTHQDVEYHGYNNLIIFELFGVAMADD
jgi:hypothetical protein